MLFLFTPEQGQKESNGVPLLRNFFLHPISSIFVWFSFKSTPLSLSLLPLIPFERSGLLDNPKSWIILLATFLCFFIWRRGAEDKIQYSKRREKEKRKEICIVWQWKAILLILGLKQPSLGWETMSFPSAPSLVVLDPPHLKSSSPSDVTNTGLPFLNSICKWVHIFHVEFNYVSYHVLFHVISQPNMDGRSGVVSMITEKVIHLTGICICIFRSMAMNWVIHLKRHMFWCRQCAVGA